MIRSILVASLIALGAVCAGAEAGTILGTVRLPAARAGRGPRVAVTEVVITLDRIPEKLERKLAKHAPREARVEQRAGGLVPAVLGVAPGTTLRYENHDRRYHGLFSVSPRFDLGQCPPGGSRTVTLDHPGRVQLFCELHPAETVWVLVAPNHAFLQPDARGAFRFPKLPKGTYVLRMWHPRYGERNRTVELKRGDAALALRF